MTAVTSDKSRKRVIYCAVYLFIIWLVAVAPLPTVLVEYRNISLCNHASLGWFFAALWGSFFIYPIIGAFSMGALVLPLATAISVVRSNWTIYFLAALNICLLFYICYVEFSEVSQPFEMLPTSITRNQEFLPGINGAICPGINDATCKVKPFNNYRDIISTLEPRSVTGWIYYFGFAAQALMQLTIFSVAGVVFSYKKSTILKDAFSPFIFYLLGYSIVVGAMWCWYRLAYRFDMEKLLGFSNIVAGDYLLVIGYVFILSVFVVYMKIDHEKYQKLAVAIAGLVTYVGGATWLYNYKMIGFIGVSSTPINTISFVILLFLMSLILLAFLLHGEGQAGP